MKYINKYKYHVVLAILILGFIFIGTADYKVRESVSEEKRISSMYKSVTNSKYDIFTDKDLKKFFENGNGILVLASDNSIWAEDHVRIVNEVAETFDFNHLYYFDIIPSKMTMNSSYKLLLNELDEYLIRTDVEVENLFTPMMVVVKGGEVIGINNETALLPSVMKPKNYWTTLNVSEFKVEIEQYIDMIRLNS